MTDAPERIYAWVHRDHEGRMTHGWHGKIGGGGPEKTEYLRADHALALVAESYEVAARLLEERGSDGWAEKVMAEYAAVNAEVIRALTPADALAARDARDEQVREEALKEAASHFIEQDIADEILALIEGNQTDE